MTAWRMSLRGAGGVVAMSALLVVLVSCTRGGRGTLTPETATPPAVPESTGDSPMGEGPLAPGRPSPRMWVAVEGGGLLALVDLGAWAVVEQHRTGDGPHNLTVARDGTVAAALYGSTEIAILRGGSVATVNLGGRPHDVKPDDDGFVVANEAARRVELIGSDGRVGPRIGLRAEPHDLDLTPDGRRAWVTLNGTDELALVDLDAAAVVRYVPTGQRPHDIRVAPDGGIWVTDWNGPVHVLTPDGELVESIPLGTEAHHLALTPDGSQMWVGDHAARKIFVVEVASREVIAELAVPGAPHHLAITPDGALAAVVDHSNGSVVVFDVARRAYLATIPVGPGPHGIWPSLPPAEPTRAKGARPPCSRRSGTQGDERPGRSWVVDSFRNRASPSIGE